MVGYSPDKLQKGGVLVVLVIIGVLLWFMSVGAASGLGFNILFNSQMVSLIIVLVVIVLAVWMMVKEDKKDETSATAPAGRPH